MIASEGNRDSIVLSGSAPSVRDRGAALPAALAVRACLACLIAVFSIYVSVETIRQHHALETRAFDLGVFDSVLWNTVHGRFFWSPLLSQSHLGQHSSLILLALAPIYAVCHGLRLLLVAQAVLLALAAWPLFLIARQLLGSETQALLVAALYLASGRRRRGVLRFPRARFAPLFFFLAYLFPISRTVRLSWLCRLRSCCL